MTAPPSSLHRLAFLAGSRLSLPTPASATWPRYGRSSRAPRTGARRTLSRLYVCRDPRRQGRTLARCAARRAAARAAPPAPSKRPGPCAPQVRGRAGRRDGLRERRRDPGADTAPHRPHPHPLPQPPATEPPSPAHTHRRSSPGGTQPTRRSSATCSSSAPRGAPPPRSSLS